MIELNMCHCRSLLTYHLSIMFQLVRAQFAAEISRSFAFTSLIVDICLFVSYLSHLSPCSLSPSSSISSPTFLSRCQVITAETRVHYHFLLLLWMLMFASFIIVEFLFVVVSSLPVVVRKSNKTAYFACPFVSSPIIVSRQTYSSD